MTEPGAVWTPRALGLLRIVTGLLIVQHGLSKTIGFPPVAANDNVQLFSIIGASGVIELICCALLSLGLCARPAAFILALDMAFFLITGYLPKSFHPLIAGSTLTLLYFFSCVYLSIAGAGAWSIDASRSRETATDRFDSTLSGFEPTLLSIYRIATGLLVFQYGLAKVFNIPLILSLVVNATPLTMIASEIELIAGALLALGLFTGPAAFILSGQMAIAYFIGHMFKGGIGAPALIPLLNGGNAAILFCFACLYLSIAGGGRYSLDVMRGKA